MKLFHVVGDDTLYVSRKGDFYTFIDNSIQKIEIPKDLYSIFAKYVLNTFIGPIDGKIIFKDNDKSNLSSDNLSYQLEIFPKSDECLCINGEDFKQIPDYNNYYISRSMHSSYYK